MGKVNVNEPLNQQCVQTSVSDSIFRYCWGNESKKTWFITKTLKCFLPKGQIIKFIIGSCLLEN